MTDPDPWTDDALISSIAAGEDTAADDVAALLVAWRDEVAKP